MRLIDADALKALFDEQYDTAFMQMHTRDNTEHWNGVCAGVNWGRNTIADAPTVDAVEVVRCRDCKYWKPSGSFGGKSIKDLQPLGHCEWVKRSLMASEYCSIGERRCDNGKK